MRKTLATLAGAAALLSLPAVATAQTRSWSVCGGNSFNTCASVDLVVTGSNVTVRVWNLSGFYGSYANTVFTGLGFENVGSGLNAVTNSLSMSGPGRGTDTPASWILRNDVQIGGGVILDLVGSTGSGIHNGISSACANALPGGSVELWQNPCALPGGPSDPGWVVLNFQITGTWDVNNTWLLVKGQNGPNGMSTECTTGAHGNDQPNCFPTDVVPEPMTIALLGTGLAGVGGFGAFKRRRKEEEAAE